MRYHALACDYDGTLATDGVVADETRAALERLRASGRKIILVTGRQLEDLQSACPSLSAFDLVVAENGAVLYEPASRALKALADPPPDAFFATLVGRGVPDVRRGHVIVAGWQPHETEMLDAIRDLGLEMQVIFNKGAVMVLPSGVNKATGLRAALAALGLSFHNVIGIGDAENDHALLTVCECGVAVANALPMLKERADLVTAGDHGAGVAELCERLLRDDLVDLGPRLGRHQIVVGADAAGTVAALPAYGVKALLAGTSGGGKSTLVTALLEKLADSEVQYCLIDPEGDYERVSGAVVLGSKQAPPTVEDVEKLLDKPSENAVVSLLALGLDERPAFFRALAPRLLQQQAAKGRPHWLIVDEAHHLAPNGDGKPPPLPDLKSFPNLLLVTVHPNHVAREALADLDAVLAIGKEPQQVFAEVASALAVAPPAVADARPLERGEALLWWPRRPNAAVRLRAIVPQAEQRRHIRKYAEGDLPPERSFYFRGAHGKLNLRAQNLISFLQIGDGVDDATWLHHLRAGDYSTWLDGVIKDNELAAEVAAVERSAARAPAVESRRAVRAAIERRYTAPA